MAAKNPFWEILETHMTRNNGYGEVLSSKIEYYAHLKGKNGRKIVQTQIYPQKASVHKAIAVVEKGRIVPFEIRDRT